MELIYEKSQPGRRAGTVPSYGLTAPDVPAELRRAAPAAPAGDRRAGARAPLHRASPTVTSASTRASTRSAPAR